MARIKICGPIPARNKKLPYDIFNCNFLAAPAQRVGITFHEHGCKYDSLRARDDVATYYVGNVYLNNIDSGTVVYEGQPRNIFSLCMFHLFVGDRYQFSMVRFTFKCQHGIPRKGFY